MGLKRGHEGITKWKTHQILNHNILALKLIKYTQIYKLHIRNDVK